MVLIIEKFVSSAHVHLIFWPKHSWIPRNYYYDEDTTEKKTFLFVAIRFSGNKETKTWKSNTGTPRCAEYPKLFIFLVVIFLPYLSTLQVIWQEKEKKSMLDSWMHSKVTPKSHNNRWFLNPFYSCYCLRMVVFPSKAFHNYGLEPNVCFHNFYHKSKIVRKMPFNV